MNVDEVKLKWLEQSLKELGRAKEFESIDVYELSNICNMGIDELRDKYKLNTKKVLDSNGMIKE